MIEAGTSLILPRGSLESKAPLTLDMTSIYEAENRLVDIRIVNEMTATEFMGTMNQAANLAMMYVGKIRYEILMAKQSFDKRKGVINLDIIPEVWEREYKSKGIKLNEDFRDAFLVKDEIAFALRDRIDCLEAAAMIIESKVKSFVRAYNAAKLQAENKRFGSGPTRSLNDFVPYTNSVLVPVGDNNGEE